jgi:hypothetical protein
MISILEETFPTIVTVRGFSCDRTQGLPDCTSRDWSMWAAQTWLAMRGSSTSVPRIATLSTNYLPAIILVYSVEDCVWWQQKREMKLLSSWSRMKWYECWPQRTCPKEFATAGYIILHLRSLISKSQTVLAEPRGVVRDFSRFTTVTSRKVIY